MSSREPAAALMSCVSVWDEPVQPSPALFAQWLTVGKNAGTGTRVDRPLQRLPFPPSGADVEYLYIPTAPSDNQNRKE